MSRILKKKRFVSFVLALFISFSVLTNLKKNEVQAFDFVVTPTVLWALGTLVLGTGIVALSHEQITDMGKMVYDDLKLKGLNETDIFDKVIDGVPIGIKITNLVVDSISKVAKVVSLYKDDKVFTKDLPFTKEISLPVSGFSDSSYNSVSTIWKDIYNTSTKLLTLNVTKSGYFSQYGDAQYSSKYAEVGGTVNYVGGLDGRRKFISAIYISPKGVYSTFGGVDNPTSYNNSISTNAEYTVTGYWGIPYSNPVIDKGYNEGLLPQALPYTDSKPGYMPIPSVIPMDIPITTDIPLTWDSVKDKITDLPLDGTINPPIEIPGVGDIDRPIDGVIDDIYNPTFSTNLDLSPLYIDLTKKFPFSIPFDFLNLMKNFSVAKERPVVKMTFPEKYYNSYTIDIDLAFYDDYFPFSSILRYFLLISFMYFLMKNTRKIMGA